MKKPTISPQTKLKVSKKRGAPQRAIIPKKSVFQLSVDYSIFAVTLLLLTSLFWAYLGAKLQSSNADQLVNSYLFESSKTFHGALLPSSHSFLLKWPLFLLIKLLGSTTAAFIGVTVATTVSTVGAFVYIMYRIDRRPAVFGTLCLCLASVLLLVPSAPYGGAILPVNMAMLASRNIEYILYIGSLYCLSRATRFKNRYFWLSALGLTILGATDKLFLTLSLGGSVLALVGYFLTRRWVLTRLAARWLAATVIATIAASFLLWCINVSGLTHIVGLVNSSPYALIHTIRSLGLGIIFGGLGLLTNFGANPAFDVTVLRTIPNLARHRLVGASGLSFMTNMIIFLAGLMVALRFYIATFRRSAAPQTKHDTPLRLAVMMLFSAIAAAGAFVVSDHYYVVDARYLTVAVFAVFISMAVYMRKKQLQYFRLTVVVSTLVTLSILLGMPSAYGVYLNQAKALGDISQRNSLIAKALASHPVDTLVGDYWRVVPIKAEQSNLHITPLEGCSTNRDILSSKNWQTDLGSHTFAYLLSFDKSLTDSPHCSLDQIVSTYGRPNSSVLISGRLEKPTEILLFYERGAHRNSSTSTTQAVLPVTAQQLPVMNCTHTLMNIVAHQDDDLLFLSPDLEYDIAVHHCVRTVYVTAGDAGNNELYWLARERGSEAAYSKLIASDAPWVERTLKLADNQFVTLANPRGNSAVTLMFMRLADGSPQGQGFKSSHRESLQRLEAAKIPTIQSVDNQSTYTSEELTNALANLMQIYQPVEVRTLATSSSDPLTPDHSDHMAVGRYVTKAYQKYGSNSALPLKYYIGYPIKRMPANVNAGDLDVKTSIFLAYSQFDGATCHSITECDEASNYGAYLARQYTVTTP